MQVGMIGEHRCELVDDDHEAALQRQDPRAHPSDPQSSRE